MLFELSTHPSHTYTQLQAVVRIWSREVDLHKINCGELFKEYEYVGFSFMYECEISRAWTKTIEEE